MNYLTEEGCVSSVNEAEINPIVIGTVVNLKCFAIDFQWNRYNNEKELENNEIVKD